MEECPGPVLPFCRQPESEQEQLACGSSRGEQQFGSVWFHGWKHLQVRNPLFPCLVCETLHCVICDTHACSQTRLGTPLPSVGLALFNGRDCVFCEAFLRDPLWDLAFRETLASVRPCLLWDPGFVRRCLLWDPSFSETLPLFIMLDPLSDLAFCETLHSVRPCLLWDPAFCGS